MPLLVQNELTNRTVFSKSINGSMQTFIWEAKDDPRGGDLIRLPDFLKDDVDFLNALDQGTLTLTESDDPAVKERIESQASIVRQRRVQASERLAATIEQRGGRDILGTPCLGPALNGRGNCETVVLQPAAIRDDEPPLCDRHSALANEFALIETGSKGDQSNPLRKQWVRAEMTPRFRQSV